MKLAMNISNSEDSHECIHHSRISPVITTVVTSLSTPYCLVRVLTRNAAPIVCVLLLTLASRR